MRSITEQTYVDEVEMDEEGIAELFMDDNIIADVASTSLQYSAVGIVLMILTIFYSRAWNLPS
jgi:hypothetical protein